MSHHYSGPNNSFPHGDARLDLTDLFAFPEPGSTERSVLIMNVHPSASLDPAGPTRRDPFATEAVYEFKIDTNGDLVPELAYRIVFSPLAGDEQTATLLRAEGPLAAFSGTDGQLIMDGAPVSLDGEARVTIAGGYTFFAGWRSDPFFFDPLGALNDFQFSGKDFFADKDVCSIVLALPNQALGRGKIGIWARTLDGASGTWVQADRGAMPSQSVFLTGDHNEEYLAADPATDDQFIPVFAHSMEHAGGYSPAEARRVAATFLPDIMYFDPTQPAAYPRNGRSLTDDVIDPFLATLTNGLVTSDGIGPHQDLLAIFPYLGPPHTGPDGDIVSWMEDPRPVYRGIERCSTR